MYFDLPLKTPEVEGTLGLVNKLAEFSDWQGNEELCTRLRCLGGFTTPLIEAIIDQELLY